MQNHRNDIIKSYILKNNFLEVELLNWGATIRKIKLKDKNGIKRNVVLSYENIEDYIENPAYLGAIVGRTAGRIENGLLNIGDKQYQLEKNNGGNNLHGGSKSISHKFWEVKNISSTSISFEIFSEHLENSFPANINIKVKYTLNDNELEINYFASTDRLSYINLTNHSYFNLDGYESTNKEIYNHYLCLNSDYMLALNSDFIPTKIKNLENSIFNFKKGKILEDFFKEENNEQKILVNNGIDHPFIIKKNKKFMQLESKESGISLEMITDNPGVVIYTGNFLKEAGFKNHSGLCFETQEIPNLFVNDKLKIFPTFINKNKNYNRYTKLIFNIIK